LRKLVFALAGLALLASGGFGAVAQGADHRDSPLNQSNPTADINDVYAFRSSENNNNLVVAISVNPLIAPSDNATRGVFDPQVQYQIHIDRNGDLIDDATANIRVTPDSKQLVIEGLGAPISAATTPPGAADPVITTAAGGAIKVFAGLRDDPFFFDLSAFQAFVAGPRAPAKGLRPAGGGDPADAFAGTNVLAIVIEAPITALTGGSSASSGTIRTWVPTTRNGQRIDRMAIPAINTALIPSAQKDAFNAANPINDASAYRATATTTINGLRAAVDNLFGVSFPQDGGPLGILNSGQVAAALIPDVVTIDFSRAVQFPNGRRLQDDVIDVALGVVLNRGGTAGISDGVSANDKAFLTAFPYLAAPSVPAAPAAAIRPPSTGDAGLFDNGGAMWALSAVFLVLAIGLGSAGALSAMRARR
jgi:hypothetical protein